MGRAPEAIKLKAWRGALQSRALVFLVALHDVATAGGRGAVRLALQVAVDAVVAHRLRTAVLEQLDVALDGHAGDVGAAALLELSLTGRAELLPGGLASS